MKHNLSGGQEIKAVDAWKSWSVIKQMDRSTKSPDTRQEHYVLVQLECNGRWSLFRETLDYSSPLYKVVRSLGCITHAEACKQLFDAQKDS